MLKKFYDFKSKGKYNKNILKEALAGRKRVLSFKDFEQAKPEIKAVISEIMELSGEDKKDKRKELEIFNDYIKFRDEATFLRKEPKYYPLFFKFQYLEHHGLEELQELYSNIQAHKNTLSQNNVDLTQVETVEQLNDEIDKIRLIEKTNKFIKLIPNPLRQKIKNDQEYYNKLMNSIIDYDYESYKNIFLRKVVKYKDSSPIEFLNALKDTISKNMKKKIDIIQDINKEPGAEVHYVGDEDEDFLIAMIYSWESSCKLGSSQWCISNPKWGTGNWKSYIGNYGGLPGVQYFIWDFRYEPTDTNSLIGTTIYVEGRSGGKKYTAHKKDDVSIKIENKPWFKYLINWDQLNKKQQINYVANNPALEATTGVIASLSENEKRKMLKQVPKLITQMKDLSFLSKDEIWDLVTKDYTLGMHRPVVKLIDIEKRKEIVIKNPEVIDEDSNVKDLYREAANSLNRKEKIEMISNKHSLYGSFDLSVEEKFDLIQIDPTILVTQEGILQGLDQMRLKQLYLKNKDRWDSKISNLSTNDSNKSRVELLFTHLSKTDSRLEMENMSNCYIYIGVEKVIDGKKYKIPNDNGIVNIGDTLNPNNQVALEMVLYANILGGSDKEKLVPYYIWVRKDLITEEDLDSSNFYKFESSMEDIINGNCSEKEQKVFDIIQNSSNSLL
jgi:hypothetical protein